MPDMLSYVQGKNDRDDVKQFKVAVPEPQGRDRSSKGGKKRDSKEHKSSNRPKSRQQDNGWGTDASRADHSSTNASVVIPQAQPLSDIQDSHWENMYQSMLGKADPQRMLDMYVKGDSVPSTSDGALTIVSHENETNGMAQQPQQQQRQNMAPPAANVILTKRAPRGLSHQSNTQHVQEQAQHHHDNHQPLPYENEPIRSVLAGAPVTSGGFRMAPAKSQNDPKLAAQKTTAQKSSVQPHTMPGVEVPSKGAQNQNPSRQSTHYNTTTAAMPQSVARHAGEQVTANISRPQTAITSVPAAAKREPPPVPPFNAPSGSRTPPLQAPDQSSDGYHSDEHSEQQDEVYDSGLDHTLDELKEMGYAQLKGEVFDHGPDAEAFVVDDVSEDASLAAKLTAVFTQTQNDANRGHVHQYHAQFMASLTIDEWEEAGGWLVQRFGAVVQSLTDVRREKRKAAIAFEGEIEAREHDIGVKRQQIKDALSDMKVTGSAVLGNTPKKGKKASKD